MKVTKVPGCIIREATGKDVQLVLNFIKSLARYEKLEDQVTVTLEVLYDSLFVKHAAKALIAELSGMPVGFAIYYYSFSTFLGKQGLYLEDLFVVPDMRGRGIGTALLSYLAELAVEQGMERLEWTCLDWNTSSLDFYHHLGAIPMSDWTNQRMTGEALKELAKR
jgi:GNAT superfamily N-acetyltransferase